MRLEISAYPGLYSIRASDRRRCDSSRPQGLRPRSYTHPSYHGSHLALPFQGDPLFVVHGGGKEFTFPVIWMYWVRLGGCSLYLILLRDALA